MSKSKKLYNIFIQPSSWTVNKEIANPTCRAIINTMMAMKKREGFSGATGDEILKEAVKSGRWTTRQDEDKYMTTWAYYVKKLKTYAEVKEVGMTIGELDTGNFLEEVLED
jgi:predicted aldo/keto reductase-like oxidoreductase